MVALVGLVLKFMDFGLPAYILPVLLVSAAPTLNARMRQANKPDLNAMVMLTPLG